MSVNEDHRFRRQGVEPWVRCVVPSRWAKIGVKVMRNKHSNDVSRSRIAGESSGCGDQDQSRNAQDASAPAPSDLLPALDERQRTVLRRVGREWDQVSGNPQVWRQALPVDPTVGSYPAPTGIHPTRLGRFVRVSLRTEQPPEVEATSAAEIPSSLLSRLGYDLKRILLGPSLKSAALAQERMRKLVALPVLSADALSSVAYGPEAMLVMLVLAGSAGLRYILPIAAVIAFLIVAVGVSYRQTIRAYPHGGGSSRRSLSDTGGTAACKIRLHRGCGVRCNLCRRRSSRPSRSTCHTKAHTSNQYHAWIISRA